MPKSSRVKHNAQPHWNKGLAIVLLIERVEIKSKVFRGFAMKHLCPNGSRSFLLLFFDFLKVLATFGTRPQQKPRENQQKQTFKRFSPSTSRFGSFVFFASSFFLLLLGEDKKNLSEHLWRSLIDTCISSFSEMLAFRIQFHCKVVLHIFSLKQLDAVK